MPPQAGRVEFVGAVAHPGQPVPDGLPHIAIAGRSNVGKSTLLNRLVGRKRIAYTSKRPGRTREINFFRVDDRFILADLPGYGFAQVPEELRKGWAPLIESYLGGAPHLLGIVLLIDARRGPSPDDVRMLEYLAGLELPTLFVLTKVDKLRRSERSGAVARAQEALGAADDQLLATSGRTGEGVESLRESVAALLEEPAQP
ncbi:MAG: ribosome biogenesis GTP-binding protein YihA/YsxC [Gemmatimonadota bacterium]